MNSSKFLKFQSFKVPKLQGFKVPWWRSFKVENIESFKGLGLNKVSLLFRKESIKSGKVGTLNIGAKK